MNENYIIGRIFSKPVSMDEHRLRGASGGCEGANLKTINQSKSWYCHPIQNYRNDQTEKIQHQHIFSKQEVDESHA